MILVNRLDHHAIMINSDLIEHIDSNPDTVIAFTNGNKMLVLETMNEIREKIIEFKRRIHRPEEILQKATE
jgi:flagellar protein FlbD